MSRDIIKDQALNKVNIVGKLLDASFRNGTLSDGRAYESANITVRVTQTYNGQTETSEIPVGMFAAKYTKTNQLNPGYEQLQALKNFKTAQNVGIDDADTIRISSGNLRENNFATKSGQLVRGWQLSTAFIGTTNSIAETATFAVDIFIMDMHPEEDREGDATGRLVIKGAIVQYQGNLDVIEFIVERPDTVEYIERNWNINDTVTVKGRIRITAKEEKKSGVDSSWGEEIPETTTTTTRELIITTGDDQGKDEELAYSTVDIQKAFNVRKAKIEQMQIDAKNNKSSSTMQKTESKNDSKYSWEE